MGGNLSPAGPGRPDRGAVARGWDLAVIVRGYLPNDPLSVPGIAVSIQSAPTGLPPQVIHCAAPPDTRPRRTAPEALCWPRRAARQMHGRGAPRRRYGRPDDAA